MNTQEQAPLATTIIQGKTVMDIERMVKEQKLDLEEVEVLSTIELEDADVQSLGECEASGRASQNVAIALFIYAFTISYYYNEYLIVAMNNTTYRLVPCETRHRIDIVSETGHTHGRLRYQTDCMHPVDNPNHLTPVSPASMNDFMLFVFFVTVIVMSGVAIMRSK